MKDTEALAIMQAIYKASGAIVSTKDADSLRSHVDAQLMDMYESIGVDRIELRVGDAKVGTLGLRKSTKAKTKTTVYVNDAVAAAKFVAADEKLAQLVLGAAQKALVAYVEETGDVPDGCDVSTETEPAGTVLGTTIRGCNPNVVADALNGALPDAVTGLLGGGTIE